MNKQNLNTHDIFALVKEFQQLVNCRLLNVYDINSHTICLKINDNNSQKKYLLIESSAKFYMLDEFQAVNDFPSSFALKLRKHLNNKRIEKIEHVNLDRVIKITFGTADLAFHLICEFYASGNIILTDSNYNILILIHPHTYNVSNTDKNDKDNKNNKEDKEDKEDKDKIKVKVNSIYPFEITTTKIELHLDNFKNILVNGQQNVDKKIKLKQFITKLPLVKYSPVVLEHSLIVNGIVPNIKIDNTTNIFEIFTDNKINGIINEINRLYQLEKFDSYQYIDTNCNDIFMPYLYEQFKEKKDTLLQFKTFSEAVTNHFNKTYKIITKQKIIEEKAIEKVEKHERAIENIMSQLSNFEKVTNNHNELIESVCSDLDILQKFLDNIDGNTEKTITVIDHIKHLNSVTFQYNDKIYKWNTKISAHANLNTTFKNIKVLQTKSIKAQMALEHIKNHKNKKFDKNDQAHTVDKLDDIVVIGERTKFNWFEQFNWFITSDCFIFVSGKTAEQNETLVKKYMEKDDIYVHSDQPGSGSGIIKVYGENKIVPVKTLIEAGSFIVCHTKAWQSGSGDRSYWVNSDQVSKTTESGEYIGKGSFIIRGHRNYMCSQPLELGLGILFKVNGDDTLQYTANSNIEHAIPVVGTYSCMLNYKFKVKITPGTQKIKKATKEVIGSFLTKANPYEKAGIKKISNDELQKVLVTGVKFHL
jgi:predicted ribosome quality control (RQC) complex YloA/Tae2 family protein